MKKINYLVVHCTATSPTATLSSIQAYWRECLRWNNPGFHYIICPDGRIVHLLDIQKTSNGVAGHNQECIHIAYIGGVDDNGMAIDNRTGAQKDAILRLLRELKEQFPKAKILGHRDLLPKSNSSKETWGEIKECPCFNAIPEYSHL